MSNIQAGTVAKTFATHHVSKFGTPSMITTDRGKQFESDLFAQLSRLLGTKRSHACAHHSQANGLQVSRRSNRIIKAPKRPYDDFEQTLHLDSELAEDEPGDHNDSPSEFSFDAGNTALSSRLRQDRERRGGDHQAVRRRRHRRHLLEGEGLAGVETLDTSEEETKERAVGHRRSSLKRPTGDMSLSLTR
ncbi:unnamed protein product [Protopolystoma xenopodis]|uniref:Integrase catalytic domain-containing protein n=1 Tax=Protopolystoma xenopodis TaxID=117903 RepID=A0A3S5C5G2_9PLAT|nr:unnamed protein product [Protopolystoma xenopodis]